MPLIKLPPLKLFGKKTTEQTARASGNTFLAMMFVNHSVQAALWKVEGEKIETLAQSSIKIFETDEDGLIQADQALQELGAGSEEVGEIIFGFDPQWVDEAGLLTDKKPFVKNLTEDLGLKPVGFVVITDALVQQIMAKNALASEVLVYIQDSMVYIFLLKQGKLVDQLAVGRSEDIIQDVVEGLARFATQLKGKDAYLPAKLVLASAVLSAPELDDAQQQITSYDWSENHPFVQAPVVESMAALDVLYAVVEQGGAAVAQSKGLKMKQAGQDALSGEEGTAAEDFGFASVDETTQGDNFQAPVRQVTTFGVPVSSDNLPEVPDHPVAESRNSNFRPKKTFAMPSFLKKLAHWYHHHPHKKMILGGAIGGVLALLLLLMAWVARSYQVALSVQLAEKVITKDVEILIDPAAANSNVAQQILKAPLETMKVEGQETAETTGVKLVGDKAKGTVTIFNKTTSVKNFAAGTKLAAGSLAFTLDSDASVSAAAVQENNPGSSTTNYGQLDVKVTASAIGADSNLGKDSALTIASFSTDTYAATAKEAFSGGSSREVRVVAVEDRTGVLSTLRKKLIAEAGQKLTEQSGNGTYYIPTAVAKVISEEYDSAAGEEADSVTVNLSLDVSGVVYRSEDLRPLLIEALKDDIPTGYQLIDEEPQFLSDTQQEATNSTKVTLTANVIAKARPPFDSGRTIESILNLPLRELNGTLTSREEIEQANYTLRPGLAKLFIRRVPKTADRVKLEITNQAN